MKKEITTTYTDCPYSLVGYNQPVNIFSKLGINHFLQRIKEFNDIIPHITQGSQIA